VYIQQTFDWAGTKPPGIQAVLDRLAEARGAELGAVFTKREVVEFVLDLAGYRAEEDLTHASLLEPSCGRGDFLLIAVERLLDSYIRYKSTDRELVPTLRDAIRAVELHRETYVTTYSKTLDLLMRRGVPRQDALQLVNAWFIQDDFLLTDLPTGFTHIVGNPPYVRQELVSDALLSCYKQRYQTIYDRADLYIPFIEHSLSLLAPHGKLAFICSDRWMKNKYGGPLRELIARRFHLQCYIDMTGTEAFKTDVTAYPAITVITPQKSHNTQIVRQPSLASLPMIASMMRNPHQEQNSTIQVLTDVAAGSQPWTLSTSSEERILLHRLEQAFPLIENAGCKVGIGVATGCDEVFIRQREALPIEDDRKLPLVMTADIQMGHIHWSENAVINPFKPNGELIDLRNYPLLRAYFLSHEALLRKRHVAKRNPAAWYRTIDKIREPLTYQPKLLIPDIKGKSHVVYDEGHYYPHHNLYVVTSTSWNLQTLQAVLRSCVAEFFVASYSIKMRGGYLRFQAQNLRRIHLPCWESVAVPLRERLQVAAKSGDIDACNRAAFELYGLSEEEQKLLLETTNNGKRS
jgi:Eco57I restriction-modification methylase/restriction endonuclease TaqI-like protein